jgi:hypothetical protein
VVVLLYVDRCLTFWPFSSLLYRWCVIYLDCSYITEVRLRHTHLVFRLCFCYLYYLCLFVYNNVVLKLGALYFALKVFFSFFIFSSVVM